MLGFRSDKLCSTAEQLAERERLVVRRAELLAQINDDVLRMRLLELRIKALDGSLDELTRKGIRAGLPRLLSRRRREAILSAERARRESADELEQVQACFAELQDRLAKVVAALKSYEQDRGAFAALAHERLDHLRAQGAAVEQEAALLQDLESTSFELDNLDRAYFAGAEALKLIKELARSLSATGKELVNLRGRGLIHVMLQAASAVHNEFVNKRNAGPLEQVDNALTGFEGYMRAVRWNSSRSCDRAACEAMAELSLTRKRLSRCAEKAAGRPQLAARLARHLQTAMNQIGAKRVELARHAVELGAVYRGMLAAEPVVQSAA